MNGDEVKGLVNCQPPTFHWQPTDPPTIAWDGTTIVDTNDVARKKWKAEREQHLARAAKADADTAETLAEAAALAHSRDVRHWLYEQSGDSEHRICRFTSEVGPNSVAATIDQFARWDRLDSDRPDLEYTLYITSPGGAVMPGIGLYHSLANLARRRPLTTIVSGFCASMASVIFQAGTKRQIERASTLLIHDISSGTQGDVWSLQDTAAWMTVVNGDLHAILASRSNLSVEEIAERAKRRDWTLNAEQAVELGLADEVI